MTNIYKTIIFSAICFAMLAAGTTIFAYQIPVVNAGPDLYLTGGQTVTLQATGYDPNGFTLNYYWSCTSGTLSSYNLIQPIYTAPYANTQVSYNCTITATNSYGNSNSDSITIYVNNNNSTVQTTYATYISNFQATLNGSLSSSNLSSTSYIYFQWGTTTNYNNTTPQQNIGYSGTFMQNIANLNSGTTYHYRAVAYGSYGTVYGQDMTFTTSGSGYFGNGTLATNKQVINITSGNQNWQASVNANPLDILTFAITFQAGNQDIHNVIVRDILPLNLIYKGNLMVNAINYGGDITSGVNIGTIASGQAVVVSYQAQVAPANSFNYGATTINSNTTITSSEAGTQTASSAIIVNKSQVYGATDISTGLTNNFWVDSFFLPLFLIFAGLWLYFSRNAYKFADWMRLKIKK